MIAALMILSGASIGAPDASIVEWLLLRKEYCSATVDGCVDQEGQQVRPNTRYAVSNVACEDIGVSKRSWRCSFDVRQTRWMDGEQVGEAEFRKMTGTFDAFSVITEDGKRKVPSVIWMHRALE
ncbi:MAG: hypothetical protein J7499_03040 [Sphingopyxis sp.]|nr:hypothetical protein [Sphingopyxis sp.]